MDKLPPYDEKAEMCVIGSCLLDPKEALSEAQTVIVSDSYFYDVRCQHAWGEIQKLEPHKVNVITLSATVKSDFLMECMDLVPSAANLPVWLETVVEKHTQREVIRLCTTLIKDAYETRDTVELLDKAEQWILGIRPFLKAGGDIKTLVKEALVKLEKRCETKEITGLSTGLHDLDRLTDGLHDGETIVIAAFPSCGKTALAVNMAVFNALKKIPVAIFSAEMMPVSLVVRSICSESRTNFKKVSWDDTPKIAPIASKLAAAPLFIEQASRLSIGQVCALARRLKQKHGIRLAVVDYIQLLSGTGDNREQEISSISKGLKAMALELNIPVIALSQLTDDGKLRESRAIGQDADSVWKLANDGEWVPQVQPVKLTVEKCRDGETGVVNLTFLKTITRFEQAHDSKP